MTPEEAVKTMLAASAPGQFDAVAEAIQKMQSVGKFTLSDGWLEAARAEKGIDQGQAAVPDHPLAKELSAELEGDQQAVFNRKPNVSTTFRFDGSSGNALKLLTTVSHDDTNNQHSAMLKGSWDIVADSDTSATVSAVMDVHSYTYENCNCQLRTTRKLAAQTVTTSTECPTLAKAVVKAMADFEHSTLGYAASVPDNAAVRMRDVRKILPVTKTRMNWDVIAHRNVRTLRETTK